MANGCSWPPGALSAGVTSGADVCFRSGLPPALCHRPAPLSPRHLSCPNQPREFLQAEPVQMNPLLPLFSSICLAPSLSTLSHFASFGFSDPGMGPHIPQAMASAMWPRSRSHPQPMPLSPWALYFLSQLGPQDFTCPSLSWK